MAAQSEPQYPDHFVARLHAIWGEGFLSPGGPEEVRAIVRGLDLAGKSVLDVGSGTGGPAIVLARDLGAIVTGIDVEPELVDRANAAAARAGVSGRVEHRCVEPGPLPFAEASFDVVFSKDALIHVPDKRGLYREVLRVLKSGGVFAASDWLSGEQASTDPAFQRFLRLAHLSFAMATAAQTEQVMRDAGFRDVSSTDRNAWYAALSRKEVERIQGPLRDDLNRVVGADVYARWLEVRRALADATASGGLRPTHLRGFRP